MCGQARPIAISVDTSIHRIRLLATTITRLLTSVGFAVLRRADGIVLAARAVLDAIAQRVENRRAVRLPVHATCLDRRLAFVDAMVHVGDVAALFESVADAFAWLFRTAARKQGRDDHASSTRFTHVCERCKDRTRSKVPFRSAGIVVTVQQL